MLRYSDRIFQELRNASLEIADLRELNQGVLRIGSGMTACIYLLPPVIEKFQKRFPKVDIQVQTGPAEVILPKVRDGALDVGVVTLPVNVPDLDVVPFAREEMVLVASPRNRKLAHRRTIRSAELASLADDSVQSGHDHANTDRRLLPPDRYSARSGNGIGEHRQHSTAGSHQSGRQYSAARGGCR